jgi:hypothetical protein
LHFVDMHAQIAPAALPCVANVAPHEVPREGAVKQLLKATIPLVHSELIAQASSSVGHIPAVQEAQGPTPAPSESTLGAESARAFASGAASPPSPPLASGRGSRSLEAASL